MLTSSSQDSLGRKTDNTSDTDIPPPLQIIPGNSNSRARRQFAARLAQRRAEMEAMTRSEGGDGAEDDGDEADMEGEGEEEGKGQRMAREKGTNSIGVQADKGDDVD